MGIETPWQEAFRLPLLGGEGCTATWEAEAVGESISGTDKKELRIIPYHSLEVICTGHTDHFELVAAQKLATSMHPGPSLA